MPRPGRIGLNHLCSARATGLNQMFASDRIIVAAAPKGLDVSTDGQTVAGEWTMSATEFRARCYRLMDEVAESGRGDCDNKAGKAGWRGWCHFDDGGARRLDSIGIRF